MSPTKALARDVSSELAFLTRALKAPTLREAVGRLAERARAESRTHEEFLAACLQREVAARGGQRSRFRRSMLVTTSVRSTRRVPAESASDDGEDSSFSDGESAEA